MGPGLALTHDPGDATIATPPDGVVAEPQLRHDTLVRSFGLGRALATGRRPMTRVQTSKSAAPDLTRPGGYGSAEGLLRSSVLALPNLLFSPVPRFSDRINSNSKIQRGTHKSDHGHHNPRISCE